MLSINQKYYSRALDSYFPKIPYFNQITKLVLQFLKDSKDDFDKVVTKVNLSYRRNPIDASIFRDFSTLSHILGFQLVQMWNFGYLRDSIFLADDTLVCPNDEKGSEALERLTKNRSYRLDHVASHCRHPFFYYVSIGHGLYDKIVGDCFFFQQLFSLKMEKAPFYFEGGNHFIVSQNGRSLCLFGKDGFYLALLQLRLLKFFENNLYQKKEEFEALKSKLNGQMSDALIIQNINEMIVFELLAPKEKNRPIKLCSAKSFAVKFQAQKETLKRIIGIVFRIWPENFVKQTPFNDLPGDDVVLVPQLAYHLDLFIHPGPNGSIFLQSFDLCLSWLLDIKKEAHQFTQEDERCWELLFEGAKELSNQLKDFLQIIHTVLKTAGFSIIAFPGLFLDSSAQTSIDKRSGVNFINGLSGYSEITKRNFYIVAGTSVGPKVGQILMNRLHKFFKQYETDVFFVGQNPKNASDFSQVDSLWNQKLAGIHCLTIEE